MTIRFGDPIWKTDAAAALDQATARVRDGMTRRWGDTPPTLWLHDLNALTRLPDQVSEFTTLERVLVYTDERGRRKLRGGHRLADVDALAGLPAVQVLELFETRIADLAFVRDLHQLRELWVPGSRITSVAPLAGLTRLQVLNISNTQVRDLGPLADLRALRELYASRTAVHDLTPLAGLTRLRTLAIHHTPVHDLSPVQGLPDLTDLGTSDPTR